MRRDWILGGLLLVAAVAGKVWYDYSQRRVGMLEERARVADSTAAALQGRVGRVDTVYHVDTVRFTRRQTVWDTVTRTVAALPDTVRVPVEVVRWVAREADSTIQACRVVVQTCEARVALRDSLLAVRARQVAILEARRPSRLRPWLERAAWVALVGAVARR